MLFRSGNLTGSLGRKAKALQEEAHTVFFLSEEGRVIGLISVRDTIKKTTFEAVEQLHAAGLRVVMVTGDNRKTAEAIANELGIDDVRAELEPKEKQEIVKDFQGRSAVVMVAGDGINDAPALAEAEVGIAMGTGTDVAIESAGITLVKGDLNGIVKAISLSRNVMKNIRQNLFFAFIYNGIGIPIAALGLLNPMFAGLAMAVSSVSVLVNSLRLKRLSFD